MRAERFADGLAVPHKAGALGWPDRIGWKKALGGLVFIAGLLCFAQDGQPVAAGAEQAGSSSQSSIDTPAQANPQAGNPAKPSKEEAAAPAADQHNKSQISVESTQLLAMALALKAEVDKTNKDTLSVNVIRKADEIEKLAKTVREKVKPGSGPS